MYNVDARRAKMSRMADVGDHRLIERTGMLYLPQLCVPNRLELMSGKFEMLSILMPTNEVCFNVNKLRF